MFQRSSVKTENLELISDKLGKLRNHAARQLGKQNMKPARKIKHPEGFQPDAIARRVPHSVRSARIGSRAAALRAGSTVAISAAKLSTSVVTSKISGA